MEQIKLDSLEQPWKEMLSKYDGIFGDRRVRHIMFLMDPFSGSFSFEIRYDALENLISFPSYGEYNFQEYCFDSEALKTIYRASEGDAILVDNNNVKLDFESSSYIAVKPITDNVSKWTSDYLISIGSPINHFFLRDIDGVHFYSHTISFRR